MVAQLLSNTVSSGSFSSLMATLPQTKEPNLGSDYNMIVWVNDVNIPYYSHGLTFVRTSPNLLVPSSTNFTVSP